mgnify:CR=1 FL=1
MSIVRDDYIWEQVGYNHHPKLKTSNLDNIAAAGLRLAFSIYRITWDVIFKPLANV